MSNKKCPTYGKKYTGLESYCTKCGIPLVKDENRCSEMKTELCRHRVYDDMTFIAVIAAHLLRTVA